MTSDSQVAKRVKNFRRHFSSLIDQMGHVVIGQERVIEQIHVCLLANGNALLEGVPGGSRSWFVYVIMLEDPSRREALSSHLSGSEIDSRTYFPPIHFFDHIRNHGGFSKGQFPVTERVAASTLALPFYTTMTDKEVDYVCDKVAAFFS